MRATLLAAAVMALLPVAAFAQEGQIAGTVRDAQGGVIPGVLVEATSPALIEKVRATTTDSNGQYRLTALPVGTYQVTFSLEGFSRVQRDDIVLTSGFTAPVNATMAVGNLTETLVVTAAAPTVDVQNARQAVTFEGEELGNLPTNRNVNSLLALTPGVTSGYRPGTLAGVCSGGVGVFCNPGVTGFNQGDTSGTNLEQGRVMVDGVVINSGADLPIVGETGGYMADIANAQEVTIQLSGALGESETGGASINIIPRTGGNTFAGNFSTTYTNEHLFGENNGNFPDVPAVFQAVKSDHDISGSFGGPIMRDRLWFYSVGRTQGIHKLPVGQGEGDPFAPGAQGFWPNLHEGKFGFNYQPDRSKPRVEYKNIWRNANARITWQASQRNKLNFFWDEQYFCQDPCQGVVSVFTSPESWFSPQSNPNRLLQTSWTNPLTNRLLLEAGITAQIQGYKTNEHIEYTNYQSIPRITENGNTTGGDDVAPRVNQFAGGGFTNLTSGSLNSALGGGQEQRDSETYRTRASASYVTGSHNAKFGYDGGYYTQTTLNEANDLRLTYNYVWPQASCLNGPLGACGNTSLQFPEDPFNLARRPIPNTVDFNTGEASLSERVMYAAFYAQDQWTLNRLTLNGALRFDMATSAYGETCVRADIFVMEGYCVPEDDGVSYRDISPRGGVAYDVFGDGRTAIKFNAGRFLNQARIDPNGIYSNANAARRGVQQLRRNWNDANGDRRVDCDLLNFAPNGECGGFSAPFTDTRRFGRNPLDLDAAGDPLGLTLTQCGRREQGIPAEVQAYCNAYGENLLEGSGKRRGELQFGLGIQHEILPRLSGEVTYNRRYFRTIIQTDQIGVGCDRFLGAQSLADCQAALKNFSSPDYDFFSVVAPVDPRLPGGGGYTIRGIATPARNFNNPSAQAIWEEANYYWHGIDTNFVWRGPGGLRVNGGTSTSRPVNDSVDCDTLLELNVSGNISDDLKGRAGNELGGGCLRDRRWETRINGTAAYTIPWVDVLVSTVFQSFAGVSRSAEMDVFPADAIWEPASAHRATARCQFAFQGVGCFGASRNDTSVTIDLLDNDELFGERITLFDLKLAKNVRIANTRTTIGFDLYNAFNSDAIQGYNDDFDEEGWGEPDSLVSPRFVRFSLQFYF